MGSFRELEFDYMNMDDVVCHVVRTKDGEYTEEKFSSRSWESVFRGREPSDEELMKFFERRSFNRHRPDKYDALEEMGLVEYDPKFIVRKTHGSFFHDTYWIRFKGEDLTFEQVRENLMGKDWRDFYKKVEED